MYKVVCTWKYIIVNGVLPAVNVSISLIIMSHLSPAKFLYTTTKYIRIWNIINIKKRLKYGEKKTKSESVTEQPKLSRVHNVY